MSKPDDNASIAALVQGEVFKLFAAAANVFATAAIPAQLTLTLNLECGCRLDFDYEHKGVFRKLCSRQHAELFVKAVEATGTPLVVIQRNDNMETEH